MIKNAIATITTFEWENKDHGNGCLIFKKWKGSIYNYCKVSIKHVRFSLKPNQKENKFNTKENPLVMYVSNSTN